MQQILHDLRLAGYPAAGAYGINASYNLYNGSADNLVSQGFLYNTAPNTPAVNATANSVSFEAAIGATGASTIGTNNPIVSIVNYSLSGTSPKMTLVRSVQNKAASGAPGATASANVVDHVSALTLSYYDGKGVVIAPVTLANANNIAEVRVVLTLQTGATDVRTRLPVVMTFTGGAYVRQ
jgi:hypothetical protein